MFRGNHPAKVDDKGRLKLPSAFKEEMDAHEAKVTKFYITSQTGNSAEIWPLPEWEALEKKLTEADFEESVEKFLTVTSYYGQQVELDTQGRVLLPQILRGKAGLDAEVAVFGKGKYLEVVNRARFEALLPGLEITTSDRKNLAGILRPKAAEN